jgi:hypothetical protein
LTARVNINVADIRRESKFRSERVSQALFNELVDISDRNEGYCRIKTEDSYDGWIAEQFLTEHDGSAAGKKYVINVNLAPAYEDADPGSRTVTVIPYGCRVYGDITGDCLQVPSDRYGKFHIKMGDMIPLQKASESLPLSAENLIAEAEKFLGAPYLWGGRTFFGIDCSGFVQCIMRRFGIELPRDSKDQREKGTAIDRRDIEAGDLLFFPGHVTLAVLNVKMIHSSSSNGGVAYNSLDPKSPLYNRYYDENLAAVKRVTA